MSINPSGKNGNETKTVIDIDQCCVIGKSHNSKSSRFIRVEMREEEGSVNGRNKRIQSLSDSEFISPCRLELKEYSTAKLKDISDSIGNVPECVDNNNLKILDTINDNKNSNSDNSINNNDDLKIIGMKNNDTNNCNNIHVDNTAILSNNTPSINPSNLDNEVKINSNSPLNSKSNKIEKEIETEIETMKKNILYTESDSYPLYLENCISHLTYRIPLGRSISEGKVTVNVSFFFSCFEGCF